VAKRFERSGHRFAEENASKQIWSFGTKLQPINGEAAMSAAENKKLVQQVYTDSANRNGTTFADNLAEDASWIVTGQYSWSHEFRAAMRSRTA
jgi:hypothetical protein